MQTLKKRPILRSTWMPVQTTAGHFRTARPCVLDWLPSTAIMGTLFSSWCTPLYKDLIWGTPSIASDSLHENTAMSPRVRVWPPHSVQIACRWHRTLCLISVPEWLQLLNCSSQIHVRKVRNAKRIFPIPLWVFKKDRWGAVWLTISTHGDRKGPGYWWSQKISVQCTQQGPRCKAPDFLQRQLPAVNLNAPSALH